MFRDLSVPSFKSDYSALTSTSGLRLFEWILNSCLGCRRARRTCTRLITWHVTLKKRAAEMNRWRGSDQAKPPITKTLRSLPKLKRRSTDHPPMMAETTKNRGRSLNWGWCERTGCTQDTLWNTSVSIWLTFLNHKLDFSAQHGLLWESYYL